MLYKMREISSIGGELLAAYEALWSVELAG
jgi:hypothetical protein